MPEQELCERGGAGVHFIIKNEKRCRVVQGLKKNKNMGDIELTLSQKINILKTDKYKTAIAT